MSMSSQVRSGHVQPADDGCPFDHWEPTSAFLTDGSTLYRYVGGVPGGTGELVVLEDCHSAKLVLFSLDELRGEAARRRPSCERVGPRCIGVGCGRWAAGDAPSSLSLWSISWAWPACRSGQAVRGDSGDLPISRAYGCSSPSPSAVPHVLTAEETAVHPHGPQDRYFLRVKRGIGTDASPDSAGLAWAVGGRRSGGARAKRQLTGGVYERPYD